MISEMSFPFVKYFFVQGVLNTFSFSWFYCTMTEWPKIPDAVLLSNAWSFEFRDRWRSFCFWIAQGVEQSDNSKPDLVSALAVSVVSSIYGQWVSVSMVMSLRPLPLWFLEYSCCVCALLGMRFLVLPLELFGSFDSSYMVWMSFKCLCFSTVIVVRRPMLPVIELVSFLFLWFVWLSLVDMFDRAVLCWNDFWAVCLPCSLGWTCLPAKLSVTFFAARFPWSLPAGRYILDDGLTVASV